MAAATPADGGWRRDGGLVAAQQTLACANAHLSQAHGMLLQGLRMLLVPLLLCPSGLSFVTAPAFRVWDCGGANRRQIKRPPRSDGCSSGAAAPLTRC